MEQDPFDRDIGGPPILSREDAFTIWTRRIYVGGIVVMLGIFLVHLLGVW